MSSPDPDDLAAAWALPAAAIYRAADLVPQRHVYLCGPTSVVNVLRSLGDAVSVAAGIALFEALRQRRHGRVRYPLPHPEYNERLQGQLTLGHACDLARGCVRGTGRAKVPLLSGWRSSVR